MWQLPRFLNPVPAAIAAAIVIPALLVLYFLKLRRQEMPVSSTLLWKKAIQDLQVNSPFQRLRKNLLLLLQLLLLVLLMLSLARPVINWTPGAGKMTVLLIDRSASMSATDAAGKTRLDEAKRRAKELIGTMDRGSSAMLIAFDEGAETIQPFTSDTSALRGAVDSVQPTDRKSRLKVAYELAEAQTNFNPEQLRSLERPDVHVYSDGRVLDENDLSIHAHVVLEKIGADTAGNVGIVALNAKRNYERPTQVQVFARLANFGPEPTEAFVELSVDGEKVAVEGGKLHEVFLLPERWDDQARSDYESKGGRRAVDSVEYELDLTSSAIVKVEQMHKEGDLLKADDIATVVVPPPKALAVLLVSDGNYFLERALDSLPLQKREVRSVAEYQDKLPADFDVILFDRYKPEKLPPAGNFIYFGELPNGLKLKLARAAGPTTGQSDGADAGDAEPLVLEDIGVLDWNREHPILRGLSLSRLYVARSLALQLPLPQESQVLLDGLKGPLIVLHREGKSTHLLITFDSLQSNWPQRPSFPIFLSNALQYLAIGSEMDVRQSFQPGATPRIPRANLQRGENPIKKVRLSGPGMDRQLSVPDAGDFALPALDHVGIYSTDPPIPQFEKLAVNLLDANESNLLPTDKNPAGIEDVVTAEGGKKRLELWWWLVAVGAVPLLLIEWWVYTRRVHL